MSNEVAWIDGASVGFSSVSKAYRTGAGLPVQALASVTLEIPAGQAVAVTGRSGSGKSTLLHLAGALDSPDAGAIIVSGHDLGLLSERQRALYRRGVGFVFQRWLSILKLFLGRKTNVATFRRLALECIVVLLAAGITGCGSSGGSGSPGPLASDNVATIIAQATTNTIAAQSSPYRRYLFEFLLRRDDRPRPGLLRHHPRGRSQAHLGREDRVRALGEPANQWMKGASSASDIQGLINVCNPSTLLEPLSASDISNATRSVTVYDGQPALTFTLPETDVGTSQPGSIVVTDTQTPVLLNISVPGSGDFTFTAYGVTKTITPPAVG